MKLIATLVLLLALAAPAFAEDGRIEINQASLDAAGGAPLVLNGPGSFVLTGNLTITGANQTAISISGEGYTLDLNGFTIQGPAACSRSSFYDATTTTCTASGTGNGITAGGRGTIRNGTVRGAGRYCIDAGTANEGGIVIEDVQANNCAQGGIALYNGVVRRSVVAENGGDGIFDCFCGYSGRAAVIENNMIVFNKIDGVGMAGEVRNNRITYNGGVGIKAGFSVHAVGNYISENEGRAIEASGGYADNLLLGNDATAPGQVSGGITDLGGNKIQ
jgi:hypothetical protein